MKASTKYLFGMAGALLFAARAAYGDIANGFYTFTPSGTSPVWDISGEYSGSLGGIDLDFTVTENSDGTFSGDGTFDIEDNEPSVDVSFSGDVTATGKVSGSGDKVDVTMALALSGSGTVNSVDFDITANVKPKFLVDGPDGELDLAGGSISVTETDLDTNRKKSASASIPKDDQESLDLPGDATGDWTLDLNVTPNGTKISGTADIETAAGGAANFTVTGTYSAKTDTSKLTLKGDGGSLSLEVATSGANVTVNSVKGKVFGQSLKLTNP